MLANEDLNRFTNLKCLIEKPCSMSHKSVLVLIISLILYTANAQNQQAPEIQFKVSKVSALFKFLNYAKRDLRSESPMVKLIHETYGQDDKFQKMVRDYESLRLNYSALAPEYPETRYNIFSSYDFLWIAAAKSKDIDDFEDRIVGILPLNTHSKFIAVLKEVEPYYDEIIWNDVQKDNKRILKQLSPFRKDIQQAFFKAATFYGTEWDPSIPFITSLIPLPFEATNVSGFTGGYLFVSEFRTKSDNDYIYRLDVIIHEMCHALYAQQAPQFQHEIDEWFKTSDSDYRVLAYNYINEGLATAIGNGWAHKMIFGELSPKDTWYNEKYINDFAVELYPIVLNYLEENKTIDKEFIEAAIRLFEKKFPNAIYDPNILMKETLFYTNVNSKERKKNLYKTWRNYYRYGWFYDNMERDFPQMIKTNNLTKVFLVESRDSANEFKKINDQIANLNVATPKDHIDFLKDDISDSIVIIINTSDTHFEKALNLIKQQETIEPGKRLRILN